MLPALAPLMMGSMIASAVGGLFQAYSGYQQAKQNQYNKEAEAKALANQADQEEMNRLEQEKTERRLAARKSARSETMYAKSGILLQGTPAEALAEQSATQEANIMQKTQQQKYRSMGLRTSAYNTRQTAKSFGRSAPIQAATGILNTASNSMQQIAWWNK